MHRVRLNRKIKNKKDIVASTIRELSRVRATNTILISSCELDKELVKEIFVDETLIQIDGQDYWLWIAYEPNIQRCLMMHLSRERTIFVCYQFFKQLRNRFGRKPILTDGAIWYYQACRCIYETNLKNKMERFVQKIKDRTECFDDQFPCTKNDCNRLHVYNWLKLYVLYIHTNMDKTRFMEFLMDGG